MARAERAAPPIGPDGAPVRFAQPRVGPIPQATDLGSVQVLAAVDLLFHRWRGTTSAEVLRKVGDISITIRL
jgi:hypothetical protein